MPKFCLNKRDSDWISIEQLLNPSFPLFVWKGVLIFIQFSCVNNGLAHQDRRGVLTIILNKRLWPAILHSRVEFINIARSVILCNRCNCGFVFFHQSLKHTNSYVRKSYKITAQSWLNIFKLFIKIGPKFYSSTNMIVVDKRVLTRHYTIIRVIIQY